MNSEEKIIHKALEILSGRIAKPQAFASSPTAVKQYLTLKLALKEQEVFGAVWLNVKNGVIACEDMFFGTLTHVSVYPREVVKSALQHNASSVIYYHNHPSGDTEPSQADKILTERLKTALELVDVRTLDHVIVAGTQTMSFAERGLI